MTVVYAEPSPAAGAIRKDRSGGAPERVGDPLDVQNDRDDRGLALSAAGVRGLRHPLRVRLMEGGVAGTVASWTLSVPLAGDRRGVHMSRLVECVRVAGDGAPLAPSDWPELLADLRARSGAEAGVVSAAFPLTLSRRTPVTELTVAAVYDAWFRVEGMSGAERLTLGSRTPVSTLCPCSKAVSDYGAHNQRAYVTVEVEVARSGTGRWATVWPEELIAAAEEAGSAPTWPLLKRPDERAVTMRSFDHPAFVEDVAREVVLRWRGDARVSRVRVEVESLESIHAHDAFAVAEWAHEN